LAWARANDFVVFTHDLDFTTLLALSHATGPSVLQIRTQDVLPSAIGRLVIRVLQQHEAALTQGALVSVDDLRARIRILPLT
jgi:predicted nuclease of predicted toxin-antitoxin system